MSERRKIDLAKENQPPVGQGVVGCSDPTAADQMRTLTFGSYLTKLQPDFDSRVYGFKKLSDLVKAKTDLFITEERTPAGQSQKQLYLRAK